MLIASGIAARQWTNKLGQMVILSAVFGAFAGGAGAIVSAVDANIPTGPLIVVVAFLLVLISLCFAPDRGLVWTLLRRRADRRRFAAQTILQDLYHYAIDHGRGRLGRAGGLPARCPRRNRQNGPAPAERPRPGARRDDGWMLTPAGIQAAAQDDRSNQLWSLYRQYGDELGLTMIADDRQQDIAQSLPAEAVALLESKLESIRNAAPSP